MQPAQVLSGLSWKCVKSPPPARSPSENDPIPSISPGGERQDASTYCDTPGVLISQTVIARTGSPCRDTPNR